MQTKYNESNYITLDCYKFILDRLTNEHILTMLNDV